MKEKRILDALNDIEERYIEDAAPGRRRAPKKPVWGRLVTAAALVLMLTGTVFWAKSRFGNAGSGERMTTAAGITEAAAETGSPETEAGFPEIETEALRPETEAGFTEAATEALRPETAARSTETAAQTRTDNAASEETIPRTETCPEKADEAEVRESVPAAVPLLEEGDPAADFFDFYCPLPDCVRIEIQYADGTEGPVIRNEKTIAAIYALLASCTCRDTDARETGSETPILIPVSGKSVGFSIGISEDSFRCGRYCFELSKPARAELMKLLEQ